jgi:hypothetical protein
MKSVKQQTKKSSSSITLTKEQYEGLARFFDTLAASAIIAAIIGHAGYSQIKFTEVAVLYFACPTMLSISLFLRRKK